MADILDPQEETTDDLLYSDKMKSLLAPKEEERQKDLWKQETQAQKEEREWIPLPLEASKKLKDHLDAQGGSVKSLENQNFLGDAISTAASSLMGNAASLNPTGFRADLGSPEGYAAAEVKAKELALPDDYREWFNPETGRVDYEKLNRAGLPQAVKRDILSSGIQTLLRMPSREPLDNSNPLISKEDDSLLTTIGKKAAQVGDNLAAQLPTSIGQHIYQFATGDAESYDPKEVLMPDEAQKVGEKLREGGGELDFGLYSVTVDPKLSLEQNLRRTSAQKIYTASDMLIEGTNQAVIQNSALAAQFLPALRSVKALDAAMAASKVGRGASKALGAVNVIANPLSAGTEYVAAKQAAASLKAAEQAAAGIQIGVTPLRDTIAQKLSGNALGRVGTAGIEAAAMQPIPLSEKNREGQVEQRIMGAGLGVGVASAAEGVAKGLGYALEYNKKRENYARTQKIDTVLAQHPDLIKVLRGEEVPSIPLDKKDYAAIAHRYVSEKAGVLPTTDARTLTEVVVFGPKDPQVREAIDLMLMFQGSSIQRELNVGTLQRVIKQIKGEKPEGIHPSARATITELEQLVTTGRASSEVDPHLATAMFDEPDVFKKIFSERYPEYANAIEKSSGQVSIDRMYQSHMLESMKSVFPDLPEDVAADVIRDASAPHVLNAVHEFIRTEDADVTRLSRRIKSVTVAHEKLSKISEGISTTTRKLVDSYSTPEGFKVTETLATEGKLRGTKRATELNLRMAQMAAEKLDRQMAHAIETGSFIEPDYTMELKKQFSGMADKDTLEGLLVGIHNFNEAQTVMVEKQKGIYSLMQKRTFAGMREKKSLGLTRGDMILDTVYSHTDGVEARLMQEFTKPLTDSNLPLAPLNEVLQYFPTVAGHMAKAEAIPDALLQAVKAAGERIVAAKKEVGKGISYTRQMKDFNEALTTYSRQAAALHTAKSLALEALTDTSKAAKATLAISNLSEMIRSPAFLEHIELVQAISTSALSEAMGKVDLPSALKLQMISALTGDTATNLRMTADGKFGFQTAQHVLNVFESMKQVPKQMVDRLAELHLANTGKELNREFVYGYLLNPANTFDRDKVFEMLGLDVAAVRYYGEEFSKRSSELSFAPLKGLNSELVENSIARSSHLPILNTASQYQEQLRLGGQYLANNFTEDIKDLITGNFPKRAHKNFAWMYWKLNGSAGTPGFFYGTNETTGFYPTDLGQIHKQLFIDANEMTTTALANHDFPHFKDLYLEAVGPEVLDAINELGEKEQAAAMYKLNRDARKMYAYFSDSYRETHNISAQTWKDVWDASEKFNHLRLKAHKHTIAIINENNKLFSDLGVHLPPPLWRERYVVEPKLRTLTDLETFQSTIYRDFLESRYFGSSESGQLAKAEAIQLGMIGKESRVDKLETPVNSVIGHIHNNIMDATSAHVRLKLEETGMLMRDVGANASADWINHLVRNNLRTDSSGTTKGVEATTQAVYNKLLSNRWTAGPSMLAKSAAGVFLKLDRVYTSLSDVTSLIKNNAQFFTRLATQDSNVLLGLGDTASAVYNTVMSLRNDPKPRIYVPPEHYSVMMRGVNGLRDSSIQNLRMLARQISEAGLEAEGRMLATRGALSVEVAHAKLNDFIMANFKERSEYANAMASGVLAAHKYEKLIDLIRNEGTDAAYNWVSQRMPTKSLPTIWGMVRNAEEGIKSGHVYDNGACRDFHSLWHTRSIGRYGSLANPAYVVAMNQYLPQTFRFFSAKMQNLFQYVESAATAGKWVWDKPIRSAVEIFDTKARQEHAAWGEIPTQQRVLGLSTLMYSLGTLALFESGYTGLSIPFSSWRENVVGQRENDMEKRLAVGTGIDLSELSPSHYSLKDVLQGYVTTKGGLLSPEASTAIRNWNTILQGIEEFSIGRVGEDGVDIPVIESELMKKRKAVDGYSMQERVPTNEGWVKAEKELQNAYLINHAGWSSRTAAYLISALPLQDLIGGITALTMDPFVMWNLSTTIEANPELAAQVDAAVPHKGVMNDGWNLVSFGNNERLLPMTDADKAMWKNRWMSWGAPEDVAEFNVRMFNSFNELGIDMDRRTNRWAQMDENYDFTGSVRDSNVRANTAVPRYLRQQGEPIPETDENINFKAVMEKLKESKKADEQRKRKGP